MLPLGRQVHPSGLRPLGWTWRPWGSIKPRIPWAEVALSIIIIPWEDYGFNHTSLHRMVRGMIMGENDTLARGIMRYCSTPSQGIMGFIHPEGVLMLPKGRRPEGSIKTPEGWMKPIIPRDGVEQ